MSNRIKQGDCTIDGRLIIRQNQALLEALSDAMLTQLTAQRTS